MAKVKKISINAWEQVMKDTYTHTSTVDWNGVEITIINTLPMKEMLTFVDNVVRSCFTQDTLTYIPEVKDFAIKSSLVEMYTNVSLPSNLATRYDMIYRTDLVDTILKSINIAQYSEMFAAIEDKIANIAQANIEATHRQMNELYAAFDNMQKQIAEMFAGIGADDMTKLVSALANSALDERKLVDAYTEHQAKDNGEP